MIYNKYYGKFFVYTDWSFRQKSADFSIAYDANIPFMQSPMKHFLKFITFKTKCQ